MKRFFASFLALILSGTLSASIALADNVSNDLDNSVDATLEVMNITTGGVGTVTFKTNPTTGGGDPDNGCNLDGAGESVTFPLIFTPAGIATPSASSITFSGTGCNATQTINVTGNAIGSTVVTLGAPTTNTTGGTYTTASASFTVNVATPIPTDSTAPVISANVIPAPNGAGWNNTDVTVTWNVMDGESAISSSSGCGPTTLTNETTGTTLTCTATSGGGTASQSVTIKIDKTAPVITGSATPVPNGNGWNTSAVTVGFTCAEAGLTQSGIATNTVAGETLSADGANQSSTNSGTCTDVAGNTAASATVSGINIDQTAPVIAGAATPAANGNGWNNTNVSVNFTCTDATSGVAVNTVAADDVVITTEGANQSASSDGDCTDVAGNVATTPVTVSSINIDKTAPVVVITTPVHGITYLVNSIVNANWSAIDALSGLAGGSPTFTTANGSPIITSPIGTYNFTVSATDLAGNSTSVTNTYYVDTYHFGGWQVPVTILAKEFKQNSTIPVKFKLTLGNLPYGGATARLWIDGALYPAVASGGSNTANYFRYDVSGGQYIFNLSTKMPQLTLGSHVLKITLNDGTSYTTTIVIK